VERRHPNPLFDVRLFRRRAFAFAILGALPAYLFMGGNGFLFPFYLQEYRGYSVEVSGLLLMFNSFLYMGASSVGGWASDRIDPRRLCAAGMGLAAANCLFLAWNLDGGMGTILIFLALWALSNGLFFSPSGNLAMGAADEDRRGAASGVFSVASRVSIALGVCLFETLYSQIALYRGEAGGFRMVYMVAAGLCLTGGIAILGAKEKTSTPGESSPSEG
jgi:MFS family permease